MSAAVMSRSRPTIAGSAHGRSPLRSHPSQHGLDRRALCAPSRRRAAPRARDPLGHGHVAPREAATSDPRKSWNGPLAV